MITPSAHGKEEGSSFHCRSVGTKSHESRSDSPRFVAETCAVIFPMNSAVVDLEIIKSRNRSLCQLFVRSATFDKRFLQFRTAFLELEFRGRFASNSAVTRTKEALLEASSNRVIFDQRFLLNNINQESVTFRLMCYSRYTGEPVLHGYSTVPTESFLQSGTTSARIILVQAAFQRRGMSVSPGSYPSSLPSTSYLTPPASHICLDRTTDVTPSRVHYNVFDSDSDSSDSLSEASLSGGNTPRLKAGSAKRPLRKPFTSDVETSSSEDEDERDNHRGKTLDDNYLSMTCPAKSQPNVPKPKKGFSLSSIPRALKTAFRMPKSPKMDLITFSEDSRWKNFDFVAKDEDGFKSLRKYMKDEKNEENLDFWKECERLEQNWNEKRAKAVYNEFVVADAPREVNLDWDVRKMVTVSLTPESMKAAQRQIGHLIERDPFRRFLKTTAFHDFVRGKTIRI